MLRKTLPICALLAFMACTNAKAAVSATLLDVGDDLVFTFSGIIDPNVLAGVDRNVFLDGYGSFYPSFAVISSGSNEALLTSYSTTISSPDLLSSIEGPVMADSGSGDVFGVIGPMNTISLPRDYALNFPSGTNLAGTSTYLNTSIASLELVEGIYTWTLSNGEYSDTITLTIGNAVPEPATTALAFGSATALLALANRKRRLKNARA